MNTKNILFVLIFALGFSTYSFGQYDNLEAALNDINATLDQSGSGAVFTVDEKGNMTKTMSDQADVVYEFNLNDVEVIQHEQQLNNHMIKFICASGKKCFHCEANEGGGLVHYLEVSSEADAQKIITAFKFLKEKTSMF